MIAIIDYGVGNLFSLSASLTQLSIPFLITKSKAEIQSASHIILPGVGAFGDASKLLFQSGLADIIKEESGKKPLMGICLGMQLLFEKSFEFGEHVGLGLIPGEILPIKNDLKTDLKVPHMGWNKLNITQNTPILKETQEDSFVYFVHSFYANTNAEYISSTAEYEIQIPATVCHHNTFGCQFHPEKSGDVGLQILKSFYDYKV